MSVNRLSKRALQKIVGGALPDDTTCIIKFYSNECTFCRHLQKIYEEIAENYEEIHFFAFNIADYPPIQKIMKFTGVPTISLIKASASEPRIRLIREPKKPNKISWYVQKDIEDFIEKEK